MSSITGETVNTLSLHNIFSRWLPLSALLLATRLLAQEPDHHGHPELVEDASLSLADVVAAAMLNQPRWHEAGIRREQAVAWEAAASGFIAGQPVLSLNYLDDKVLDDIGEREIQAGMSFPLWWPDQKRAATGLAEAMKAESSSWESALAWSVAGEVRRLLGDMAIAEAALAAADHAVADAQQLLTLTEAMFGAGEVARGDVMQARTRMLDMQALRVEADAMVVDAHREYEVYTGLDTVPAGGLAEIQAPDAEIDFSHPLLAEYQAGLARARQQTEQQRLSSRGSPTLTVGARNQRGDRLTDSNTTMALSVSIPLGGKRFTSARVADARRAETDIEVTLLEQQRVLQTQLHEVEHDMLVTSQKLTLAVENAELAETRWQMARSAWELGEITMGEVMIALQQQRESRLQLTTLQLHSKALVSAFNQTLGVMP